MNVLLDTHLILWAAADSNRLPRAARKLIEDSNTRLSFSAASLWEVSIKSRLNRSDFQVEPRVLRRSLLDNNYSEVAITGVHAAAIQDLPPIHKDPFDRILIAQARCEGLMLLTADPLVAQYPGPIQRV